MPNSILQIPRDVFPTKQGISDNNAENRKNARAEIREAAASSTSELNELPNSLMDVLQVADCLCALQTVSLQAHLTSEDFYYKNRETSSMRQEERPR